MVVLSKADFDALLERIEDAEDVATYDARKAELGGVLPPANMPENVLVTIDPNHLAAKGGRWLKKVGTHPTCLVSRSLLMLCLQK